MAGPLPGLTFDYFQETAAVVTAIHQELEKKQHPVMYLTGAG